MSTLSTINLASLAPANVPQALRSVHAPTDFGQQPTTSAGDDRLREVFTQFVGETFFGQMIKAMRSTVGKPAYFHGGRGEEVFRGQLDQALAEHMTKASADRFAEPMFRRQFPHLDDAAASGGLSASASRLNQLDQLTRP